MLVFNGNANRAGKMKIHSKKIQGVDVKAWSDSGFWAVQTDDFTDSLPKNKWSMKDAMEFAAKMQSAFSE